MKSFPFLCVSFSLFIPLVCPRSLLQFQFIIRKPDERAPPLRLSSLLHPAPHKKCFNLHLSAARPLSACLSVYCKPSPSAPSNKEAVTLLLSEFTPPSTKSEAATISTFKLNYARTAQVTDLLLETLRI